MSMSTPSPTSKTPPNETEMETDPIPHPWEAYQDDEGRTYFYNTETNETTWDLPGTVAAGTDADVDGPDKTDEGNNDGNPIEERNTAVREDLSVGEVDVSAWLAYEDDQGRTYYYNTVTEVTQWEKPDGFDELIDGRKHGEQNEIEGEDNFLGVDRIESKNDIGGDDTLNVDVVSNEDEPTREKSPSPVKEKLTEEEKKELTIKSALDKLSEPDMLLEPDCLSNVSSLVSLLGGSEGGLKAIECLTEGYEGQSGVCAIMGTWLKDLHSMTNSNDINVSDKASSHFVLDIASTVIEDIVKEKFTNLKGDAILRLSKASAKFLQDMMASQRWRRLLIDLYAEHKDSALLMYCLQTISKKGFHREITSRVNQSDHFGVFNGMLVSELEIAASLNQHISRDIFSQQMKDLRRMCTSTSYTYLYASELLNQLIRSTSLLTKDDNKSSSKLYIYHKRWTRLFEELEKEMLSSSTSNMSHMSSLMTKKRRVDVTLAISDLSKKRKHIANDHKTSKHTNEINKQKINECVLSIIRKNAVGMRLEAFDLPDIQLLKSVEEENYFGKILARHPTAITSLLSSLFKPGSARIRSDGLRKVVSDLIALVVIASKDILSSNYSHTTSHDELQQNISKDLVTASQLCESIENMVSFSVTESPNESDSSVGSKLCFLCMKRASISSGVIMWAHELASGPDFVASASYATLTPSILSVARIIAKRHKHVRPTILDLAIMFLNHKFASSREISYQQSKALKEQCLRLLIWLISLGEAPSTLTAVMRVLNDEDGTALDASLIRYFVTSCLDVIHLDTTSFSVPFIISMSNLLCAQLCIDALMTNYFEIENKQKLAKLIHKFASLKSSDFGFLESEQMIVSKLIESYKQLTQDNPVS